jgi:hypothetical protein
MIMALIMYFTRAPRYENISTKDIKLMESFFAWKHENEIAGAHSGGTFEEWCGHSESELPNLYVMKYFYQFYAKREMYVEGIGRNMTYGIFEQLSRLVKANQVFGWFYQNVMNSKKDHEYYEITQNQLKEFLGICNKVKDGFTLSGTGNYVVNEDIAKEFLPVFSESGYFFGGTSYDENYANNIIEVIEVINNILTTTDFDKQTIYFNAIW